LYARDEVLWQLEDSGTQIMVTLDVDLLWSKVDGALRDGVLEHVVLCRMSGILPFPKNFLFPLVQRRHLARVKKAEKILPFETLIDNDGRPEPVTITPDDPAVFQYTGG